MPPISVAIVEDDLLVRGYLYKEIAEALQISVPTVNTHIRHIYEKMHVQSRGQAVAKYAHITVNCQVRIFDTTAPTLPPEIWFSASPFSCRITLVAHVLCRVGPLAHKLLGTMRDDS